MLNLALLAALQAAPVQDHLTLQHIPLAEMLRHPKDAGLARLLAAAPGAIERFAATQGDAPPPGLIELAVELLTSGKSLALALTPGADSPVRASLVFTAADAAAAARRESLLIDLMALAGVELGDPLASGLRTVAAPLPFPVALGTLGTDLALTIGTDTLTRPAPVNGYLPRGATTWLEAFQSGRLTEALVALEGGDPTMGAALATLSPWDTTLAVGSDGQSLWFTSVVPTGAKELRAHGAVPDGGLPATALALVPEDAVFAFLVRLDWAGTVATFESYLGRFMEGLGQEAPDFRGELTAALGLDLFTEVLPHVGPTAGMYLSDTTGGGGLTSGVFFAEVRDVSAVNALTARLASAIEAEAGAEVELRVHRAMDLELTSLVAPGLPIPVVPTWVVDRGYLYIGLSPQAAVAAVEAARAGGGLGRNPRFRAGLETLGLDASVVSINFLDTPELLRDGYPYASLALDALGNLVRGAGESGDLGLTLPSLGSLRRDARATVGVTKLVGDDVVSLSCSDLSLAVNVAGLFGLLDRSGLMLALPLMFAGVQSASYSGGDWDTEPDAAWYEPIIEGGSLVALNDWAVAGIEETTGVVLAQLEVHLDDDAGTLSVYVVDAEVTGYVRTAQESIVVTVYPEEGEPYELTLQHVANELTGEVRGDSSHFRVADPRLQGLEFLSGNIGSLTIGGATFESVSIWGLAP